MRLAGVRATSGDNGLSVAVVMRRGKHVTGRAVEL